MKTKLINSIKALLQEKKAVEVSEYERKRREFAARCAAGYEPSAGELANMLENLTPDGFDKLGRKVSFIERGTGIFEREKRL